MDTQDTSPSVLLFFDNQRFIFNAGEVTPIAFGYYSLHILISASRLTFCISSSIQGLQRFCTEHKIKLSKVSYIF